MASPVEVQPLSLVFGISGCETATGAEDGETGDRDANVTHAAVFLS